MDKDLQSIQEARELVRRASEAQHQFKTASQEQVDRIVEAMASAGARDAERLAKVAHEETGFGRVDSKTQKNLFATKTLAERMRGMKTAGIIRKLENDSIWEIATPMGVVAALIPTTNPTSTAMYKAIISAKARCGIVMSPHPRAAKCTAEALRVVAEAAYKAGAPAGLFGCMTHVSLEGTNALLEHPDTDVILATGGSAMVRAAYSKGKPAYGVGSGNVPVYVDRSANIEKAAKDILYGTSFDWGTLCSTERSVVADYPIRDKLKEALKRNGGYFCTPDETEKLRRFVYGPKGFNTEQIGQSPVRIAQMAGFSAPDNSLALIAEVDLVGREERLSMETLSPILSFYVADGWQKGCERCIEILEFGGIGHTLGIHATSEAVIEAFALEKPAMRIVVNTVAALGSVGYTNRLFPSMTLGPGTVGGSITSDNVSPLHLLNVKRLAFETDPINPAGQENRTDTKTKRPGSVAGRPKPATVDPRPAPKQQSSWIDEIEARLRARAGNLPVERTTKPGSNGAASAPRPAQEPPATDSALPMAEDQIDAIVARFRKK
jgi:acetaldehyde dehydrogenase (acetylating)